MKKTTLTEQVTVNKELEDLIVPLSKEEFRQLEMNIVAEGCREALIAWDKKDKLVLVDGHNRFRICSKHNIPFQIQKIRFDSLDEVKIWMFNNQLGRRNLNPDQLSYYRGLKYLGLKRKKGGYDNVKLKGQHVPSTAEHLSREFKVSESTIKRDAKYAEGLEVITRSNPKLKNDILSGEVKLKKSDVALLTQADETELLKIKNASDLHNKLNFIKNRVFTDIEEDLKKIEDKNLEEAQRVLAEAEPLFSDKDTRIKNIKGRIISVMNKAIRDKDIHAIGDMKGLIEKLEILLSEG